MIWIIPASSPDHETVAIGSHLEALEKDTTSDTIDSLTSRQRSRSREPISEPFSTVHATETTLPLTTDDSSLPPDPNSLEEEAEAQGAFNEETGEINWDCPCLGGMAHGPCGPEFREAFSCFVFSKEEPKGMDCIEKFKGMQECFQRYPDVYKGELEEDEELEAEVEKERAELAQKIAQREASVQTGYPVEVLQQRLREDLDSDHTDPQSENSGRTAVSSSLEDPQKPAVVPASSEPHPGMSQEHESIKEGQTSPEVGHRSPSPRQEKFDQNLELMPKPWHDARTDGETARDGDK